MKSLSVKMENCYGIQSFKHTFDFTKSNANVIYAPNGMMKTSFAKTFLRLSEGLEPEEKLYKRTPVYNILFEETSIESDEILVVRPFDPNYESEHISTLLVNPDKKERYDKMLLEIIKLKKKLIAELNRVSKEKKDDIEALLMKDFECSNIFEAIEILKSGRYGNESFSEIPYKQLFDTKVIELLKDEHVKESIKEYVERYNELIEKSDLFKKGVFSPAKANTISKALKKEKFFEASHRVLLNGQDKAVCAHKELNAQIELEKKAILGDGELRTISRKMIEGVASVKLFQELLEKCPEIATEVADIEEFKKTIWGSYFLQKQELFADLYSLYDKYKSDMTLIENEALLEDTLWFEVLREFKERFHVPFTLEIENYTNAILGTTSPNIVISFRDGSGEKLSFNRGQLNSLDVLSIGERRAMYLLYIIFEIKARMASGKTTLIVIDDIADSFDYKNKYAIIEYLKEMTDFQHFRLIVLTHNFDFYRTFQARVLDTAKWECSYIAEKDENIMKLLKGGSKNVSTPFDLWRKNCGKNSSMLIAMIPFVRNLIEYRDGTASEEFIDLTSMLHIKADKPKLKVLHLVDLINGIVKPIVLDPTIHSEDLVLNLVYETAEELCNEVKGDSVCLEGKIALSIAIRLKAEEFMWENIRDKTPISKTQTGKLYDRFSKENQDSTGANAETLKVLNQVILMTPENIHINSFMYEPLMDMSNHHLITLYKEAKALKWS